MGKKARKTRWRALSISGPQSDSESQTGETPKRYAQHNPRATAAWQNGHYPHSNGHQRGRYHSSHSTPTRYHHHNGYYASKSTRSSSTASDNKITFNEDEYTRITTPRQDVLFKKGYLSKPKPYLQQHHQQQQQQLTSAGNSTGDGTPDHQSADGAELGDYEYEHTSPFIFPNGFIDQNGICYINGVHGYEPYPQMMMYNPVCYPPPYMNHRVKRYSTDSMTESMSPNNECTDGASSAGPEFNPVYGFVYPDGVDGYVPYNHHPADTQEAAGDAEQAPDAEPAADEDGVRRLKKRRRRKESQPESDEAAGTSDEEDDSEEAEKLVEQVETKQEEPGTMEVLQSEEATAQSNTCTPANDTLGDNEHTTNHHPSTVATTTANHSDTQHQSNTTTITHNDTLKEPKTEDTTMTTSTKYRVDAEEFVPRAYRAVPMPSFMPVPLVGDMFTGAFVPPPPGVAINFMPAGHYEEFLPHGYAPIPRYMEHRYSRKQRNQETVESATTVVEDDTVETSTTDVQPSAESNGETSTATEPSVAVTDSRIVAAEQSNTAQTEISKEPSTDSCTADQTSGSTSTETTTGAEATVQPIVPQCNAIDIAKIVSKLEQAAKEQQRCEQHGQKQQPQREKRQNVPKLERRGGRRPQQQQQQNHSEEHGPTQIVQEEVVVEKKATETQTVESKDTQEVLATEPSTPVTKDVPSPAITSTTNVLNYSDKLKCTTRPPASSKKPITLPANPRQHTCPRLERSNRHPDNTHAGRKHTNIAYDRTDSASDSSSQSTGHTTKHTPANGRTETAKRTEQNADKKTNRSEPAAVTVKPVQSAAVTSTDQWISVSSKKKRKGRQELATSPVGSGSDQDSTAEQHNSEQVEQTDIREPTTNDTASEPTDIVQDTIKEPTITEELAETEPQTKVQVVDVQMVESTTSSVTSTPPRAQEMMARKTKNNKKQVVRKRIIINDEQLTLDHQQQQLQPQQIEPQHEVKPTTAVPEVTQLPTAKETVPAVHNKPPETIIEPVISTETSSDDAKTIASDGLSTVTVTTTTDSEQTVATTPAAATVASSSKQKRRKKKTKTAAAAAAATANKSALDSTSDEWTLTADEDTTSSSIALDSDESSKTNVEVSLEIDRMIQRGLFANLEEKLKSFNPSDSFIHSATLDIIKVAPPPPPSLDNGTKYGVLGNFKNFDFSGLLLGGMQQSRQHNQYQRVMGNAEQAPGSCESLLEADEDQQYVTPSATTPAAVDDDAPAVVQVSEDLPPVSTHVSRLPITRAVKEWMHRTRESTPEVEIFKRPNEIRHELLVLATEALDEDVARRGGSTSRESSAVPDLLDCWEDASVGEVRAVQAETVEHSGTFAAPETGHIEQGEDALEMYESVYGKNADYLSIRREVDECHKQSTAPGTLPKHARDGGLPYRAICCTVM
ncbi:hypothetical protein CBL_02100 [Carabus blaptoides fortunei]